MSIEVTVNLTANGSTSKYKWNGGTLSMSTDSALSLGTLTLKWSPTDTGSGVTVGTLAAPGAITPSNAYGSGYIWVELTGATSPDIDLFFGKTDLDIFPVQNLTANTISAGNRRNWAVVDKI